MLLLMTLIKFIIKHFNIQKLDTNYNDNDRVLFSKSYDKSLIIILIFGAIYLFCFVILYKRCVEKI